MKDVKSKKQICARRRRVFVIIIVIIYIFVHIFISFNREYRYAGKKSKWQTTSIRYTEGIPVLGEYSQYCDEILLQCKDAINNTQELREQYPYLNWQCFEEVKVSLCERISLPNGTIASDGIYAKYYVPDNTVLIMKSSIDELDAYFLMRIVIHELMHCLIRSSSVSGVLYEGLAELFCQKVCEQNDISFTFSEAYKYDIWVTLMLENVFGRQKLMYLAYYNILNDVIDKYTKNNYGKMVFDTLENLSDFYRNYDGKFKFVYTHNCDTMIRIIQDVLVHFTVNYSNEDFCMERQAEILKNCNDMLELKEDYFKKILGDEETQLNAVSFFNVKKLFKILNFPIFLI